MDTGIRCFLAIVLPPTVHGLLRSTIAKLKPEIPAVRWVDPKLSHLTLHFLGNAVSREVVAKLPEIGRNIVAQYPPFRLHTADVVLFPRFGPPKVISIACDGPDMVALKKLRTEFGVALKTLGVAIDVRPWQPHLTIGRFPSPLTSRPALIQLPQISFTANAITFYQSTLTPAGPHYDQLDRLACTA